MDRPDVWVIGPNDDIGDVLSQLGNAPFIQVGDRDRWISGACGGAFPIPKPGWRARLRWYLGLRRASFRGRFIRSDF